MLKARLEYSSNQSLREKVIKKLIKYAQSTKSIKWTLAKIISKVDTSKVYVHFCHFIKTQYALDFSIKTWKGSVKNIFWNSKRKIVHVKLHEASVMVKIFPLAIKSFHDMKSVRDFHKM